MTDPVRLLESADEFERALLGSAKRDAGSERALGRALAAVSGALVTLGATSAAGATAGAVSVAKWLGAGALLGLVTTGAATLVQDHLSKPRASVTTEARRHEPALAASRNAPLAPAPERAAEPTSEPPAAGLAPVATPEPAPQLAALPAARAVEATPSAAAPSTNLARELQLLESARQSLNHGDAAGALATLSRYRSEFPSATLGPEAELLEVQAHGERGESAAARRIGEQFLLAHPNGPYAVRVRGLLDALPER